MDGTIRNTGAEGLLEILCCGLERDAEQRTANRLGDRSRYVGLSDIAKMLGCPRAALAAKLCLPESKTLVKLSNINCSSNGGTGSRRAYTKLS